MPRAKNIFRVVCAAAFITAGFLFAGCVVVSKIGNPEYDAFRENRPVSILVLPPLNNSLDVDAPNVILASSVKPLAESGYYVIPVALSMQMFAQNGIQTAFDAHAVPHRMLREIFGADAALYITITRFGSSFQLLRSVVQVEASARLVDLRSGQELWKGNIYYEEEPSKTNINAGGGFGLQLLAAIGSAIIDQVSNDLSNASYDVGSSAMNTFLTAERSNGILFGPYNPNYETD